LGSPSFHASAGRRIRYLEMHPMEDRAHKPDTIDQADAEFRKPSPTIEELMADVEPIKSWDDLDIPDLTDEKREAFAAALAEARER
jgi:hypothetical protein